MWKHGETKGKKILWNLVQAKEEAASEASKKELLGGAAESQGRGDTKSRREKREPVGTRAPCDMAPVNRSQMGRSEFRGFGKE